MERALNSNQIPLPVIRDCEGICYLPRGLQRFLHPAYTRVIKVLIKVTYRFVSGLNDRGFIEGRYVPVTPATPPTSVTKPVPPAKDEPVEAKIENGSPSPESGGSDVDTTTREPASIN
ncbi:hypothetical protein SELMODRAFT_404341 [Selaginella moellendorffii]|uniref:Uncharacterized protein n=1 Tax=Selaginella moellendorffii TaxID=88036 RepID=D8QV11_SELML|nr:hypothetical protein SELMODRAFT_404341 [Selaginella moellendorffii]